MGSWQHSLRKVGGPICQVVVMLMATVRAFGDGGLGSMVVVLKIIATATTMVHFVIVVVGEIVVVVGQVGAAGDEN